MSITALLDLIRQRFSPSEGKIILESLTQDKLVWQFVQDEARSLPYFESAPHDIQAFAPGPIALWLIEQDMDLSLPEVKDLSQKIPDTVKKRGAQVFQTLLNTGLPPIDLLHAGLLALTLRERRNIETSWKGISKEILRHQTPKMAWKGYQIWCTPFACLADYCPDFEALIADFTTSKTNFAKSFAIPVFLHALLANPKSPDKRLEQILSFAKDLPVTGQLTSLQWLESFEHNILRNTLARRLMQTRANQTFFAEVFSDMESIEIPSKKGDPLENNISFSLPEKLNRLAAFHYHSGDIDKAVETYQKSCDLINTLVSQTRFQALALQGKTAPPSAWLKMLQDLPNSNKTHLFHIRSLIENENFHEAREQLKNIPESPEKQLLAILLNEPSKITLANDQQTKTLLKNQPPEEVLPSADYYIRRPHFNSTQDWIPIIRKLSDPKERTATIRHLLQNKTNDLFFLTFARDELEQAGFYDQALEVASLLERLSPESVEHQRALARLYAKSSRWPEAFSLLQKMVREMSAPETKDLASLAESALMTGRNDMAISICQNILTKDKANAHALILLGKGYMKKGDVVKAIQHMEQVVSQIPEEPQTWIHLAQFWENSGQIDRAFEILRQGLLAIPDNPDLLQELGQAHLKHASPTEAKVYLKKAFTKNPTNSILRQNLAEAEYLLGNHKRAYELLEPLADSFETDFLLARLLGNVHLALGSTEKAKPILVSAARQNPTDLGTVLKVSDLVLGSSEQSVHNKTDADLEEQEKILNDTIQEFPNNPSLELRIADLHRLMGHYQKAHDIYTQLAMADHNQKDLPAWRVQYGLGLTSTALGEIEIGLAALKDAALKQPENLQILHALAETLAKADLKQKAFESAKSALNAAPQDVDNLIWFAQFNTQSNRIDEALQALSEARQISPERLDLILLHAKTLNLQGATEEAIEQLDTLLSNKDVTPSLLHQTAYQYIQTQDLNRAALALEKAVEKCGQIDPLLLMDLSMLYTLMDQRKKALEMVDLPEENLQESPPLAMLKADLLSQLGQFDSALRILDLVHQNTEQSLIEKGASLDDLVQSPLLFRYDFSFNGYLFRRGQLLRALGKPPEAQTILENAIQIAPEDHQIQNALMSVYLAGLNADKALEIAEKANPLGSKASDLDLNQLDLVCTQTEILLDKGDTERVNKILTHPALLKREYPRLYAVKSRQAVLRGHIAQARELLQNAVKDLNENLRDLNPANLSDLFRLQANLQSMVYAFLDLEAYTAARQYQQEAWQKLKTQPNINLAYLQLIIKSAENQQIAKVIKLRKHAPGPEVLDDKYYQLGKVLLDSAKDFLSLEDIRCLQARLESAFLGKWPTTLVTEPCLKSPDDAAAFILGCDDEAQVKKVLDAFSKELAVLQAAAIFNLKTSLGDGKAWVKRALEIDTSNPVNHALLGLMNFGNPTLAVNSFATALRFWPEESGWHRILADLHTDLGDAEKAARHISLAIENEPENSEYWQTRAGIHLKLNQLEQAKSDLERSTQLQSQNAASWVNMADVNRRLGNVSEALENMRTASQLKPEDTEIAIREIKLLLNQGCYQEAAEKAASKIGKNGNSPQFRILLARSMAKLGDFDRALEILSSRPGNPQDHPETALETLQIKKERDGIEKTLPGLIRLAEQHPQHPEILKTLTDWLIQAHRLQEAQETAQTILRIIPDSAEVHLMLGRLQRLNGQLDQAISHLSEAIAHKPDLIEAYIELGKTYQDRRDLEEAIKIYQMGSKVDASDPRPYYHAGMALKSCKDYSSAEAMLKQAKKYAPSDPNIIRQLGVITALNLIDNLRETR